MAENNEAQPVESSEVEPAEVVAHSAEEDTEEAPCVIEGNH